jgi:hypothetical protein
MTDTNEATDMIEPEDLEDIIFLRDFTRMCEEMGFRVLEWKGLEALNETLRKEYGYGFDCQD